MDLYARAADAFTRARQAAPDFGRENVAAEVTIRRARLTRELAGILGVDPALITVTDDVARSYLGTAGQLLTVWLDRSAEPPTTTPRGLDAQDALPRPDAELVLRFVPVLGHDGVFAVLSRCADCNATDVPVAAITSLADLGAWVVEGRAPDNGLRYTLGWDLGHMSYSPWNNVEE
jgi:hypothetical protein